MGAGIGIDIGRSYTKAVYENRVVMFPTQAGRAVRMHTSPVGGKGKDYHLLEPFDYYIGELAIQQRVGSLNLSPDWVLSEEYRALYLTALAAVTKSFSTRYTVVTGLPLSDLHLVAKAKPLLLGSWQPKLNSGDTKKTIKIDDVAFVAQGIGALFLLIIDENGRISDPEQAKRGRAGILDVGSKTTNIIAVDGIQEVAIETGAAEAGTWRLEDTVRRSIVADHDGWGERFSPQELMASIIGDKVVYDGDERINISTYVDEATRVVAKEITDKASVLWSDGRHLRRIIVCGGGAKLMMSHIKERFGHAQLIEGDPQLANVRGYHRYAKFLASHAR